MSKTAVTADDIDGHVECPCCGEELGETNIREAPGQNTVRLLGGTGGLWTYVVVECDECGELFEVGGPVGVTGLPEDV